MAGAGVPVAVMGVSRSDGAGPGPGPGPGAGGGFSGRGRVVELQRARLLVGAVRAVDELGWSRVTISDVTARARVSRRTFYDLFGSREGCLLEALQELVGRVEAELVVMDLGGLCWRERVRVGLWTVLSFFDREPVLARFCVVQSARGGERVLEYRNAMLTRLACVIDEGRGESARAQRCPSLTAEGLVGACSSILHARLLSAEREPVAGLLGELMSLIVLPYLGAGVAGRECARPMPRGSSAVLARDGVPRLGVHDEDPSSEVPMRLTYRTVRVLEGVSEHPGLSNRQAAEYAGVSDQGQISKLLGRLQRLGLIENTHKDRAQGERNAWSLAATGQQVMLSIAAHSERVA